MPPKESMQPLRRARPPTARELGRRRVFRPRAVPAYPGEAGLGPWPTRHWRFVPVMQPGPRGGDPDIGDSRRSHRRADPAGETALPLSPSRPRPAVFALPTR